MDNEELHEKDVITILERNFYVYMFKSFPTAKIVNDINAKLTGLSEKLNEFTSKYDKVYSELQQCKSFNSHLLNRIIQLDRNAVTNSQYSRRETIEVNPVPAEIQDDVLEASVCKALSLTRGYCCS